MSLYERIERELLEARRQRDSIATDTLGLLKSEVVVASKEPGRNGAIDDDLVLRITRKEVKRREEAIEAYRGAGRTESAAREQREAELLRNFLPAQLSEEELEQQVRAVIADVNPSGPQGFGMVMKEASARLQGRAEGGKIAAVARRLLAANAS
jgi:uncharacterized protein YqeY